MFNGNVKENNSQLSSWSSPIRIIMEFRWSIIRLEFLVITCLVLLLNLTLYFLISLMYRVFKLREISVVFNLIETTYLNGLNTLYLPFGIINWLTKLWVYFGRSTKWKCCQFCIHTQSSWVFRDFVHFIWLIVFFFFAFFYQFPFYFTNPFMFLKSNIV